MKNYSWYQHLKKPSWAPPAWVFGPVWTVLYIIIAISFGAVFYDTIKGDFFWIMAIPFGLNLIFNAAFTPIQFRLKSNLLACIDIILVLLTLVLALWFALLTPDPFKEGTLFYMSDIRWVAWVNLPYLLWVSFATVLQINITWKNRVK